MSEASRAWGAGPPLIDPGEFPSWILHEDERLLVVNKPGLIVCHPSKQGPWSSLVGAAREYCGLSRIHLVFRLDRETSGVVVLAKDAATAGWLQSQMEHRQVAKFYLALLAGELAGPIEVDQPLGRDAAGPVHVRQIVTRGEGCREARTRFEPLATVGGFTAARVLPQTGRMHQIRAHAAWLGQPVVGDKVYGPDPHWYLRFIESGWTPEMESALLLPRQALHAWRIRFGEEGGPLSFTAPVPSELGEFASRRMGISETELERLMASAGVT